MELHCTLLKRGVEAFFNQTVLSVFLMYDVQTDEDPDAYAQNDELCYLEDEALPSCDSIVLREDGYTHRELQWHQHGKFEYYSYW